MMSGGYDFDDDENELMTRRRRDPREQILLGSGAGEAMHRRTISIVPAARVIHARRIAHTRSPGRTDRR